MPHTRSQPRRLLQDCMQALSYFVKTINEPECLILRQAVQLRDILSDLETCLTQDHCQDACYKIAYKLSYFVKTVNEPECLILRQAVQLQDILSDPETCLTQHYCQDARDKIGCKLSHRFSRYFSRYSNIQNYNLCHVLS